MKKKKKNIPIKQHKNSSKKTYTDLLKNFSSKMKTKTFKDFIIVFLITFTIATIITTSQKPINTHPTMGDADYYYRNAVLFSKVWKSPFYYFPGLLFNTLSKQELLEIGFNHQSDFDSFFRAPGYITFLSVWITIFGKSELAALLSQCFLLSLLFGLIYIILRLFTNRPFSYIGVFLALLYLTFYTNALQTMAETFEGLMILIFFYAAYHIIITKKNNKKYDFIVLSLLVLLVSYSKMSLKFLYIPFIIVTIYFIYNKYKKNMKAFKKFTATFIIAFIMLALFANLITSRGSEGIKNANLGGWRNYWAGSCRLSDGFGLNTADHEKEFRDNLNKGTQKFWFNRYSEICKYAVIDTFKHYPFQFISMTLKKIGLLLSHAPQNDEVFPLLRKTRAIFMNKYHLFLLIISMLVFLFFYDSPQTNNKFFILKSYCFTLLLYLSILFGLSNPGTRYFLPIIPFYIIFTTIGIHFFIKNTLYKNKKIIFLLTTIPIILLLTNITIIHIIFHNLLIIRLFRNIFYSTTIVFIITILFHLLKSKKIEYTVLTTIVALFIIITSSVFIFDTKYDNHFKLSTTKTIKQIININNFTPTSFEKAFIAIDISTKKSNIAELKVILNNAYKTNIKIKDAQTYFSTNYPLTYNKTLYKPHWIFFEIPIKLITKTNIINVKTVDADLYYSYKEKSRRLPSFFYYKPLMNETVYGPFSNIDERCYPITKLNSKKRLSFINSKPQKSDIHIFLLLKKFENYYIDKRYEKFNDTNIKYIALVNPLDRKIVFWSSKNPGDKFMKIRGNLYLYIASEMDRFHSSYQLY